MNYTSVKNPIWTNEKHTMINCDVNFNDLPEEYVPFTADPSDTSNPSSKTIYDQCVAGDYGTIAEYVPPPPYVPNAEANKQTASKLLYETDWTTIADVADPALSNPYLTNQSDFFAYRSALRQIAVHPVDGNIDWPAQPTAVWSS
jgi:hypothetical protein